MRYGVLCFIGGASLGLLGIQEVLLKAKSANTPTGITLKELIEKGPGPNKFIVLKDFIYCDNILFKPLSANSTSKEAWESAWTPIIPNQPDQAPDRKPVRFQAILKWPDVRSETHYKQLSRETTLKGMVINDMVSLSFNQRKQLQEAYPDTDFNKCWIIEVGRAPGGFFKLILLFTGAGLLFLGGAAGIIVALKQKKE